MVFRKNYEGWRRENLKLQEQLLASQERVFELQDKLLSLREERMTIAATLPRVFAVRRIGERWSVLAGYPNLPYLAAR